VGVVVGELNHVAFCLAKAKPGQREIILNFRIPFERILLATSLWVFLDYLLNGIMFQRSHQNMTLAVEEAEKLVTGRLSEYILE
jgi:hypothetical protein